MADALGVDPSPAVALAQRGRRTQRRGHAFIGKRLAVRVPGGLALLIDEDVTVDSPTEEVTE